MEEQKNDSVDFIVAKKLEPMATPLELQIWCAWLIGLEKVQQWSKDLPSPADDKLSYHISLN